MWGWVWVWLWWVGGRASERVEGGGEEMWACACAHACVWLASM